MRFGPFLGIAILLLILWLGGFLMFHIAGGLIGLGVEQLQWPRPVKPGDVLHVDIEVLEARSSRSHADRGIVRARNTTLNQNEEIVQTMVIVLLVPRRGGMKAEGSL